MVRSRIRMPWILPAMPHDNVPRFTHNFLIYDHGAPPAHYTGHLFGVEPIQGRIVESEIAPDQSSFRTWGPFASRHQRRPLVCPVDVKGRTRWRPLRL